jgi:hypothetical protein
MRSPAHRSAFLDALVAGDSAGRRAVEAALAVGVAIPTRSGTAGRSATSTGR